MRACMHGCTDGMVPPHKQSRTPQTQPRKAAPYRSSTERAQNGCPKRFFEAVRTSLHKALPAGCGGSRKQVAITHPRPANFSCKAPKRGWRSALFLHWRHPKEMSSRRANVAIQTVQYLMPAQRLDVNNKISMALRICLRILKHG